MKNGVSAKSISIKRYGKMVRLDDIMSHHPRSNTEHIIQDMHDILNSYYQVAQKRVVDVICMQATEYHLLSGPASPLKLFSPAFVMAMTPEQLEQVAGEDIKQKRMREQPLKEMEKLEKGKKILI
jgi:hypothetical protein